MKFTFTGKNLAVSQEIKDHVEKKMARLQRLFPEDIDVFVTFSVTKQDSKVEVSIPINKRVLRAEVSSDDMLSAVDGVVDVLDRQRTKYMSQLKDRSRRNASLKEELNLMMANEVADDSDGDEIIIERMKSFPLKPMESEEAVMEMEMLGHNFYVFRNPNFEVNVVYKRKNGAYGLICPNDPADCE